MRECFVVFAFSCSMKCVVLMNSSPFFGPLTFLSVCEVKPCSFNGVYQPSLLDTFPTGKLLALSYFTDRIQPLLKSFIASKPKSLSSSSSSSDDELSAQTLSIEMLAEMAKDVCGGEKVWKKRWGKDSKAMEELEGRPEYCLDLTFMHALLGLGEFFSMLGE